MKTIEIKNRFDGSVIYSGKHETLKDVVVSAVANRTNLRNADLRGADLSDANLRGANLRGADLRGADLSDAYLRGANLSGADLSGADLRGANLRGADLRGADLSGADLSGAGLSNTIMPGFADSLPTSLQEAAIKTKEWLLDGHWTKDKWIETPTGAYAGDCKACLHGAAVYIGGEFGPELSKALDKAGYGTEWNDDSAREVAEVAAALDQIAQAA